MYIPCTRVRIPLVCRLPSPLCSERSTKHCKPRVQNYSSRILPQKHKRAHALSLLLLLLLLFVHCRDRAIRNKCFYHWKKLETRKKERKSKGKRTIGRWRGKIKSIRAFRWIEIRSIRFNRNIPALIYIVRTTRTNNMINAFICFGFLHELASF